MVSFFTKRIVYFILFFNRNFFNVSFFYFFVGIYWMNLYEPESKVRKVTRERGDSFLFFRNGFNVSFSFSCRYWTNFYETIIIRKMMVIIRKTLKQWLTKRSKTIVLKKYGSSNSNM